MRYKIKFFAGFILLNIVCWAMNVLFYENELVQSKNFSKIATHSISFLFLLIIAFLGNYSWSNYGINWAWRLWVIMYSFVIGTLLICGIIDFLIKGFGNSTRELIGNIRLFFTCPMPFLIIFIMTIMLDFVSLRNK